MVKRTFSQNIHCLLGVIAVRLYALGLKVDKWHLRRGCYCDLYRIDVSRLLNNIPEIRLLDFGCGIGCLLSEIYDAWQGRGIFVGYDPDMAVIKLARRLLRKKNITLTSHLSARELRGANFNVICALNFLHGLPVNEFHSWITEMRERFDPEYLCIDIPLGDGYGTYHQVDLLSGVKVDKQVVSSDGSRELYLLRLV